MATVGKMKQALCELPDPIIVGVSGGVDSVAMLHALIASGRKPVVAHFDHGWRTASAADAKFVQKLAREAGLKFVGGKGRQHSNRMREAEARTDRYNFFSLTAKKLEIVHLVLAHQADDQVETFLLQLLRGSGSAGRGMDPLTQRDGLILHRPWLGVWRKEILAYARRNRLVWREDATNKDPRHRRNLLRARILPYLCRQISSQVAANLWRAAEIARAEGEWLDALCAAAAEETELDGRKLLTEPPGKQRRIVLRWLQARGIRDIGFADVEAVRNLMVRVTPAKTNLSGGKFARRRAGKIFLE